MPVARWPHESPEYAKVRDELHAAEVALRDQRERVAELRRKLPQDTAIEDQTFREVRDGALVDVKLSELVGDDGKPLILMHFMYGGAQASPCPMCTSWADAYDGALPHLARHARFAILIAGDPGTFGEYARSRGWRNVRIVSTGDSEFKRMLEFENAEGGQAPGATIVTRAGDGTLRHFYSVSAMLGADGFRGMDLLNPLWHFIDLLPAGRGDFMPSKRYD